MLLHMRTQQQRHFPKYATLTRFEQSREYYRHIVDLLMFLLASFKKSRLQSKNYK
jgi:hypothetical protein